MSVGAGAAWLLVAQYREPEAHTPLPMESLPRDLLPSVISNVTARDAVKIRESVEGYPNAEAILQECDRRLCIKQYLGKSFYSPEYLLEAMSRSSAIICGSRALEFFVPGSCNANSDWNFHVPGDRNSLRHFVKMSMKSGVRWLENKDAVLRALARGKGVVTMGRPQWYQIRDSGLEGQAERMGYVYTEDPRSEYFTVSITVEDKKVMVEKGLYRYRYGVHTSVIHGVVTFKGNELEARIRVASENGSQFASLHYPRSSDIQCYLSAHVACHLYGDVACKKQSYKWTLNLEDVGPPDEALEHASIGYTVQVPDIPKRGFAMRNADDDSSTFIELDNRTEAPYSFVSNFVLMCRRVSWYESLHCTGGVDPPELKVFPRKLVRDPWSSSTAGGRYAPRGSFETEEEADMAMLRNAMTDQQVFKKA